MLTIKTDHEYREILYWNDLTETQQKGLCEYEGIEESSFFLYKDEAYDLGNFIKLDHTEDWDGGVHFSAFSGLLVKFNNSNDRVMVGYYYE